MTPLLDVCQCDSLDLVGIELIFLDRGSTVVVGRFPLHLDG